MDAQEITNSGFGPSRLAAGYFPHQLWIDPPTAIYTTAALSDYDDIE